MSFDQDAFISYAHIDNEPLTPGQRGWVTQFHATLQTMLSQRLGEQARIWRDDKLDGNDVFADEIVAQFTRTALLVSILTPRYLRSEWCTRELREFCAAAAQNGGITFGNQSRVFKIVKTPVDTNAALPDAVQRTLGYDFFAQDEGAPRELDPAFGDVARQQFLSKISSLAWEVAKCLQQLRLAEAPNTPDTVDAKRPARTVVFLAECGRDLREAREQLATELRVHGHEVLPAEALPQNEDALVPELQSQLARCTLAIHLVGRSVGPVPDGPSGQSLVVLQNRLSAERCHAASDGPQLRRIIWLPEGVVGERAEQQSFIDALQRDAALQFGADLLRGDIETLKSAMHHALHRAATTAPSPPAEVEPSAAKRVHVLMSEADRTLSVPLLKLLRAQGLQVSIPVFVGDAASLREANAQLLADCDAVILLYATGDEVWKFHQQNELRKQAASASVRGRAGVWTALAPPASGDKELLQQLGDPLLIDALAGWSTDSLQPLLASLGASVVSAPAPAAAPTVTP